ncbi:MAG: PGPGW domain-containing protein [Dokdonella sp.]
MTVSVRRQWQHFEATPSGRRFQTRHRMRRGHGGGVARKVLICGMGVLIVLAGIVMIVLPGPGMLAIVIGATLIAEESLFAARMLDRIDLWVTGLYKRWRSRRNAHT